MNSILTKDQKKEYRAEWTDRDGDHVLVATARYDDQCGNGHNTFAITGTLYGADRIPGESTTKNAKGKTLWCYCGGCVHDEIAKHIPELAPYIKWHLVSSDEPMHYVENTLYLAGSKDYNRLEKGEFRQFKSHGPRQNGGVEGVPAWELERPGFQIVYADEKPADVVMSWKPYGRTGEGKGRELDAARRCAVWPEATDEELCLPRVELRALLVARLPKLMEEFKAAVESLGFVY